MIKEIIVNKFTVKKCLFIDMKFEKDGSIRYLYAGRWRTKKQVLRKKETTSLYHKKNKSEITKKKNKRYEKNKDIENRRSVAFKSNGVWKNKRPTKQKAVEYSTKYYVKNKEEVLRKLKLKRSKIVSPPLNPTKNLLLKPNTYEERFRELEPLIKSISREYSGKHHKLDYHDLYQEGCIGLLEAHNNYSPDKGALFKTYAYLRIKGSIINYVRNNSPVSRYFYKIIQRINKYLIQQESLGNKKLTPEEISKHLDIDIDTIIESINLSKIKIFSSDGNSLEKESNDEPFVDNMIIQEERLSLKKLIELRLNDREKKIVNMYYYEEMSQKEIAEFFRISVARASQIIIKIPKKLKG